MREIKEETGVLVRPLEPIGITSFFIEKNNITTRLIAIFRLAEFVEGDLTTELREDLALIEKSEWLDISKIDFENDVIEDQVAVIKKGINLKLGLDL